MIFAATSTEDVFRKPRIGMWNMYAKEVGITRKDGKERGMYVFNGSDGDIFCWRCWWTR